MFDQTGTPLYRFYELQAHHWQTGRYRSVRLPEWTHTLPTGKQFSLRLLSLVSFLSFLFSKVMPKGFSFGITHSFSFHFFFC